MTIWAPLLILFVYVLKYAFNSIHRLAKLASNIICSTVYCHGYTTPIAIYTLRQFPLLYFMHLCGNTKSITVIRQHPKPYQGKNKSAKVFGKKAPEVLWDSGASHQSHCSSLLAALAKL